MNTYAYDLETFRNCFTATFVDVDSDFKRVYVLSDWHDDRDALKEFLSKSITLVGFNSIGFDDVILKIFLANFDKPDLAHRLFKAGQLIIYYRRYQSEFEADRSRGMRKEEIVDIVVKSIKDPDQRDEVKEMLLNPNIIRKLKNYIYDDVTWKSIDVMKIMAFDKLGVSLKQTAINLKWHWIQDLPFDYDKVIERQEVDEVLKYNLNDVLITKEFYHVLRNPKKDLIQLRKDVSALYDVDVISASDSRMANLILEAIWERHGLHLDKKARTTYREIHLKNCLPDYVKFQTPILQALLDKIKSAILYKNGTSNVEWKKTKTEEEIWYEDDPRQKFKFKDEIIFDGNVYDIGVGGLHSQDNPQIFESNENIIIRDADVASYYPNIILNNKLSPKHLDRDQFIEVLEMLTSERLKAKREKDTVKAEGLKITINSIFGKLGSKYFWLQDAQAFLFVTLTGQLSLLMLIEMLYLKGIHVISANTDGIVSRISKEQEATYYEVCNEWSDITHMTLEYHDYEKYVRSNVNNYIVRIKNEEEPKRKGWFSIEVDLKKGYKYPIVAKALEEYFLNNVPIEKTIYACTNILDFCISQKAGGQFNMIMTTLNGVENLQKNNRFFISNSGGALGKINKNTNGKTGLYVGEYSTILNLHDPERPFAEYDVKYDFYIKEAYKIADEIQPRIIQYNLL